MSRMSNVEGNSELTISKEKKLELTIVKVWSSHINPQGVLLAAFLQAEGVSFQPIVDPRVTNNVR